MSNEKIKLRNSVSVAGLVFGPFFGVAGLGVGGALGGCLMGIWALAIVVAVWLCLGNVKQLNKTDETEELILQRMLKEGTLNQRLMDAKSKVALEESVAS